MPMNWCFLMISLPMVLLLLMPGLLLFSYLFFPRLIIKYRFSDRVKKQMHAFMEGFNDLIPQQLLTMFDPNELEVRE